MNAAKPEHADSSLIFNVVDSFDFTSREYRELFDRSAATAFQHPIWLEQVFARLAARHQSAILVGRTGTDGRLAFVLPMIRRGLGIFGIYDAADFSVGDYSALVVDREIAEDAGAARQIVDALSALNLLRIRKVRDTLPGLPARYTSLSTSSMPYKAHEVELSGPVEHWQTRLLKTDFARYLRSKRKRLGAKGAIKFQVADRPDQIRAAFEKMREFRHGRWTDDLLADRNHFEFYVEVAVSGHRAGFARTYVLSVDDAVASVLFGLHHQGRFMFLLMGFDNDRFRNSSAGLLALESGIEDCLGRGDNCFDLTIGDEAYKKSFATRSVPMSIYWFGKRPWIVVAPLALTAATRVRSMIGKMPAFRPR